MSCLQVRSEVRVRVFPIIINNNSTTKMINDAIHLQQQQLNLFIFMTENVEVAFHAISIHNNSECAALSPTSENMAAS